MMEVSLTGSAVIVLLVAAHFMFLHEYRERLRVPLSRLALCELVAIGCSETVAMLYTAYVGGGVEDVIARLVMGIVVGMTASLLLSSPYQDRRGEWRCWRKESSV